MADSLVGKNCPYCQSPIAFANEARVCPECRTPHHRECWYEYGGCTMYGCRCAPRSVTRRPRSLARAWAQQAVLPPVRETAPPSTTPLVLLLLALAVFGLFLAMDSRFFAEPSPGLPYVRQAAANVPTPRPRVVKHHRHRRAVHRQTAPVLARVRPAVTRHAPVIALATAPRPLPPEELTLLHGAGKLGGEALTGDAQTFHCDLINDTGWTLTDAVFRLQVRNADGKIIRVCQLSATPGGLYCYPYGAIHPPHTTRRWDIPTDVSLGEGETVYWEICGAKGVQ